MGEKSVENNTVAHDSLKASPSRPLSANNSLLLGFLSKRWRPPSACLGLSLLFSVHTAAIEWAKWNNVMLHFSLVLLLSSHEYQRWIKKGPGDSLHIFFVFTLLFAAVLCVTQNLDSGDARRRLWLFSNFVVFPTHRLTLLPDEILTDFFCSPARGNKCFWDFSRLEWCFSLLYEGGVEQFTVGLCKMGWKI